MNGYYNMGIIDYLQKTFEYATTKKMHSKQPD